MGSHRDRLIAAILAEAVCAKTAEKTPADYAACYGEILRLLAEREREQND
jgi:hypothetical protein